MIFNTNYKETNMLLDGLKQYIDLNTVKISTENTDWRNRKYKSDLVTLINEPSIGFEVFEDEIIVYYFTDHVHFSHDNDSECDYIKDAQIFLDRLFSLPIKKYEIKKGNKLLREKYTFLFPNDKEENTNTIVYSFGVLSLFSKKITTIETWQFDKEKHTFTQI